MSINVGWFLTNCSKICYLLLTPLSHTQKHTQAHTSSEWTFSSFHHHGWSKTPGQRLFANSRANAFRWYKVKLATDIKMADNLLSTWSMNLNNSKTKVSSFNRLRELLLPSISMADANRHDNNSLRLLAVRFSPDMKWHWQLISKWPKISSMNLNNTRTKVSSFNRLMELLLPSVSMADASRHDNASLWLLAVRLSADMKWNIWKINS